MEENPFKITKDEQLGILMESLDASTVALTLNNETAERILTAISSMEMAITLNVAELQKATEIRHQLFHVCGLLYVVTMVYIIMLIYPHFIRLING